MKALLSTLCALTVFASAAALADLPPSRGSVVKSEVTETAAASLAAYLQASGVKESDFPESIGGIKGDDGQTYTKGFVSTKSGLFDSMITIACAKYWASHRQITKCALIEQYN